MKTMIVTGASSGIGHAIALRAARDGFATLLVARNSGALEKLAQTIHAEGGLCATLAVDVRDEAAAPAIVSTATQRYGRIDIVVNNAGIAASGHLLEQSDDDLNAQWETHILAPLRLTRWALPALYESGGQVFFFGSGVARIPMPGMGAYPAAKAAVRAIATQMRRELRGTGVAVTYVDPGAVDTPLMERAGMQGPPKRLMVPPQTVADCILRATRTRPRTLNAVPWQSAGVAMGDLFPALTDVVLAAFPQLAGANPITALDEHKKDTVMVGPSNHGGAPNLREPVKTPIETAEEWHVAESAPESGLEKALAPVSRRMERVKLSRDFIQGLLVAGTTLDLGDVAMRWAGMPNKNERAAVAEVFEALVSADYLRKTGDETWTVVRSSNT